MAEARLSRRNAQRPLHRDGETPILEEPGTGSGGQANTPGLPDIDPGPICDDAAALIGASPRCQGGTDGYDPYDRPVDERALALVTDTAESLPLSPGAALPVLPKLPAAPASLQGAHDLLQTDAMPTGYDQPGATVPSRAGLLRMAEPRPQTHGFFGPFSPPAPEQFSDAEELSDMDDLTGADLPRSGSPFFEARSQRGMGTETPPVPGTGILSQPGGLPKPKGLSKLPKTPQSRVLSGRNVPGLPGFGAANGMRTTGAELPVTSLPIEPSLLASVLRVPNLAQGTKLPETPVVPVSPYERTSSAPLPGTLLPAANGIKLPQVNSVKLPAANGGKLPGLKDSNLPGVSEVPVNGNIKAPQAAPEIGPMKSVAAQEPITGDTKSGAMWVLGVAAMFAAMAGALALTRRVRLGGRR